MPILNEIADRWMLFAAILAAGFGLGWGARQWLLDWKRRPVIELLDSADWVFLIDEDKLKGYIQYSIDQIKQIRAGAEASMRAADLTERRTIEFQKEFIEIYKTNLVPNLLRETKKQVSRLDPDTPAPPRQPAAC